MRKLYISIVDTDPNELIVDRYSSTFVEPSQIPDIMSQRQFQDEDIDKLIMEVIAYLSANRILGLEYEIEEIERLAGPPKEMTIKQIEKELGYRITLIPN